MCKICVEYNLGKLTTDEALRNLSEMDPQTEEETDHLVDLFGKLYGKSVGKPDVS